MVKAMEPEMLLIKELQAFKKEKKRDVNAILYGIELTTKLYELHDSKKPPKDVLNLISKLKELEYIINSLQIDTDNDNSGDRSQNLWIRWSIDDSDSGLYYYREAFGGKPVTEKTIVFALTSFEKEICSRLSVLETLRGGHDYFCYASREALHNIIKTYMEA